jgi:UDP-glucose 4-epimerase
VERFIYASTIYVYSREGGFYRCSKQSSEHYVEEYSRVYDLDYTILRYGSLYGPRSDKSNGVFRIIESAIKEKVISYTGNIESLREYIHVVDAAKSSVEILNKRFRNESIIITGPEMIRVHDFLEILAEILGFPGDEIKFENTDYIGHYVRTPYAYQPKLGKNYSPDLHTDLGQGLLQLIEEIRSNIEKR